MFLVNQALLNLSFINLRRAAMPVLNNYLKVLVSCYTVTLTIVGSISFGIICIEN